MPEALTVSRLLAEYGQLPPAASELAVGFGGCHLRLRSNSAELIARLSRYFRPFLTPAPEARRADVEIIAIEAPPCAPTIELAPYAPEPGKLRIKEEYANLADGRLVRKRLTGMVFAFGGERHLALGPCLQNDNQVVNFVNSRFIQWLVRRGHLLCHAAGLAQRGRGLALAGFSGRGKSTLALHLLSAGLDFVSNDRLLVRRRGADAQPAPGAAQESRGTALENPGGGLECAGAPPASSGGALEMFGVAKLPRVNPGTLLNNPQLATVLSPEERERYRRLPRAELRQLEAKYDVDIEQCFGRGRFRLTATLAAVFILNWSWEDGPTRIERVDLAGRPDLLAALMKRLGLFFEPPGGGVSPDPVSGEYLAMLGACPVFEVAGGVDFAAAQAACRRVLDEAERPS